MALTPMPPTGFRLIGQDWIEHGYTNYHYDEPPPPCIIDGVPLNSCTGDNYDGTVPIKSP